jgi:anti-sigma factor RsiW
MIGAHRITNSELCAYIDGDLSWPSRLKISILLALDAKLVARAASFARQNRALRSIGRSAFAEPIPDRLLWAVRCRVRSFQQTDDRPAPLQLQVAWLAAALLLAAGCIGWLTF